MADILLQSVIMAINARMLSPTKQVIATMSAIQSTSETIGKLTTQNKLLFAAYMVLLLLGAIAGWLVWRTGNALQDTIRIEAQAKIEESKKLASQANERAQILENQNLTLRGQVATLETHASEAKKDVAGLQTAAADAKAAQQRVEIELSKQREQTANAIAAQEGLRKQNLETEKRLEDERLTRIELERAVSPRLLIIDRELREALRPFAGMEVSIETTTDFDSSRLATMLRIALVMEGWKVVGFRRWGDKDFGDGVKIIRHVGVVAKGDRVGEATEALVEMLGKRNIEARMFPGDLPPNTLQIEVGLRPVRYFLPENLKKELREFEQWRKELDERLPKP